MTNVIISIAFSLLLGGLSFTPSIVLTGQLRDQRTRMNPDNKLLNSFILFVMFHLMTGPRKEPQE